MKIVCLSDTHQLHNDVKVPDGDVLIHAGDFTHRGRPNEFLKFADWFMQLPHKHKLLVCGNHEFEVSENTEIVETYFNSCQNITVLHNKTVEIEGLKFYGEPRTPNFFDWGWKYERGKEAEEVWSKLPEETDILVCHGPPFGYGDRCADINNRGIIRHVGCRQMLDRLKTIKPKVVICGHIHYDYGIHATNFGTLIINAAICTEGYKAKNKPIVFNV